MTATIAAVLAVLALPLAAPAAPGFDAAPGPSAGGCPIKLSDDIPGSGPGSTVNAGLSFGPKACRYALSDNGSIERPQDAEFVQSCRAKELTAKAKLDNGVWSAATPTVRCGCYKTAQHKRVARKFDNRPAGGAGLVPFLSFDDLLNCISPPEPVATPAAQPAAK